ncbi:transporter substrate-binding domain-containing protein [Variovorax sp. J22R133]|uniref:amino acid ABC transporter substrate-binding protein n=1 Tax=Variovorax brevis TaxID=3053503 RepID=UPI00257525A3|nr:transporter substrate-binding domain-containing protein [Variovorax sp. J22R133]MDM0115918.1 transporter substrate-binding domain-containing protein [Variovorax sp. J22R133]
MRRIDLRLAALGAMLSLGTASAGAQALTVCVAENNPPLSYEVKDEVKGLDVRVAQAIAQELNWPLQVVPFESKYENEATLSQQVNAMLSSKVCEIASGFPLIAGDLGPASRPTARVPDHPGAPRPPQRPWVPLGTLAPSHAYHTVALALVVRDAARQSATLANPGDARIGVTAGTMTGTIVTLFRNGKLRAQSVGVAQNEDALELLEAGKFDATLVSLDRLDAWRLAHPSTAVRRTGYLHPLRINIGFVARAESTQVLAAADRVIDRAIATGDLERWTVEAGSTWVPADEPQVSAPIGLMELMRE